MHLIYLADPINFEVKEMFLDKESPVLLITGYDILCVIAQSQEKFDPYEDNKNAFISSDSFFAHFFKQYDMYSGHNKYQEKLFNAMRYAYYNDIPMYIIDPAIISMDDEYVNNSNKSNLFDLNSMYREIKTLLPKIKSATLYGQQKGDFLRPEIEVLLGKLEYQVVP